MGLDSYLTAKKYMSTLKMDDNEPDTEEVTQAKEILARVDALSRINPEQDRHKSVEVVITIGYWRKANHIHKWFVDNVQGGNHDCQESYVPQQKLEELLGLCEAVMLNKDKSEELLPTTDGFFFGGTEYDEWFYKDVEYTIQLLKNTLAYKATKEGEYVTIHYRASW